MQGLSSSGEWNGISMLRSGHADPYARRGRPDRDASGWRTRADELRGVAADQVDRPSRFRLPAASRPGGSPSGEDRRRCVWTRPSFTRPAAVGRARRLHGFLRRGSDSGRKPRQWRDNRPAESHMDMDDRAFFEEAGVELDPLVRGDGKTHDDFCRPVVTEGRVLDFARARLLARAEAMGWTAGRDADLHLLVDGDIQRPLAEGDAAVFLFRESARDVRVVSNTFVPARIGLGDMRELGVALYGLVFVGSGGEVRRVSLDDPRLGEGLHGDEASSGAYWRWTKGELVLDPQFWAGLTGQVALFVNYNAQATRQWIPPARRLSVVPVKNRSKQRLYSVR